MPRQSGKQKEIVGRVMHEFKHGALESGAGRKVKNPRQAIAIGLREAGASNQESPAQNRRSLARTTARGKQGATAKARSQDGPTRAALYAEATRRGIRGRSAMNKQQLAKALGR